MPKLTVEVDCQPAADVLNDYFGITLPDQYLIDALKTSGELIGELVDKSISDTCARGKLIDLIVRRLDPSRRRYWPINATPRAEAAEFYRWLESELDKIGGKLDDGRER